LARKESFSVDKKETGLMASVLEKLKKLRGRSAREMRVRAGQALSSHLERRGLSEQARVPETESFLRTIKLAPNKDGKLSAESLLENFRKRSSTRFFASFDNREETMHLFSSRWPDEAEALTERARRITQGRFDLLGLRDLSFGQPIDWHLEPLAGKRAPLRHWSRIDYLSPDVAGDKKITWELNRHQYFTTLGRAYWLTRDELYAETFVSHVSSWMIANPPKLGINWASSLEVSLRAISWLWALYFFRESERLGAELFLRLLKYLYVHARHLETYLSTYFSPNTHLTGEALGLFYLGTLLPEMRDAERWRTTGRSILLEELDRHVRGDGVYFEQSSYYHRYTTDFYTHLLILSRANGYRVEAKLEEKLKALLEHLMYIQRPDGTTPFFGDDDGGRLVMLDEREASDFRAPLSTGACLFERGDYKFAAGTLAEETLWLLGPQGVEAFDRLSAHTPAYDSSAFTEGGYYVMRDGWARQSNYLLVDAGPHGGLNYGHAHADALSFELSARGRSMLVDPGTYTYTGSAQMRNLFRSTAAHNTLTIDNESQSLPCGPFDWKTVARSSVRRWMSLPAFDFFEGEHDGYERLPEPAKHVRSILFIKGDYWIVRDRVETRGSHQYDLNFHFAPDCELETETVNGPEHVRASYEGSARMSLFVFGTEGHWRTSEGFVSPCYGKLVQSPRATFSMRGAGSQDFISLLMPDAESIAETSAREIEAVGGRAFEMNFGAARDMLLMSEEAYAESMRVASDFQWAWMRFETGEDIPSEAILIRGRRLKLYGLEVLYAKEPLAYLFMRRAGADLYVESDSRPLIDGAALGASRVIFTEKLSRSKQARQYEEARATS
jgi:uncharacterized heparinase superfamily protein